jgi:hypothetical protein
MRLPYYLTGFLFGVSLMIGCQPVPPTVELEAGMTLTKSTTFTTDTLVLASDTLSEPVLVIEGDGLTIDFSGLTLIGSQADSLPHTFTGLAIHVQNSRGVTLRNLNARGYKVAIMAENSPELLIEDCDLSYNYRQRMGSTRKKEDLSDWLYYHHNEDDEWLRYGAAIYLKECDSAMVRNVRVTGGQNGLMMTRCNDGQFYNNTMHFNSGIGIGMYRSSRNQVMHNRLDWNLRGYSYGIYARGQDSAGILCYEQSNENVFAYNSATHSGDGFFLWAGQHTMDTGEGGCNDNLLYGNDFSHAPTNGIEVTFSRNTMVNNKMLECRYGIWGGYSFESLMAANWINDSDYGIAIEHGQDNTISHNLITNTQEGIKLWQRDQQPPDWGYAQKRDTRSRDYLIQHNDLYQVEAPLVVAGSRQIQVNPQNRFQGYQTLLTAEQPNQELIIQENTMDGPTPPQLVANNERIQTSGIVPEKRWQELLAISGLDSLAPAPLPDGMDAMLPSDHPRGHKYMLVNEWGPYDFLRPSIWLRETGEETYTFLLLGPQGNWRVVGGSGFAGVTPKTGSFPTTMTARLTPDADSLSIQLEFVGEAVTTQFGENLPRGTTVRFAWKEMGDQGSEVRDQK